MKKIILSLIIATTFVLTSCASQQKMSSIGNGTDQYKESPCACEPIPMPNV
ncbi:MAG: hypothetical protein AB7V00_05255 [Bacilli bacterium]